MVTFEFQGRARAPPKTPNSPPLICTDMPFIHMTLLRKGVSSEAAFHCPWDPSILQQIDYYISIDVLQIAVSYHKCDVYRYATGNAVVMSTTIRRSR